MQQAIRLKREKTPGKLGQKFVTAEENLMSSQQSATDQKRNQYCMRFKTHKPEEGKHY